MSGGLDSAVCAHFLQSRGQSVQGVFFNFGQPAAAKESKAARALTARLNIPLKQYRVSGGPELSIGELTGRNAFLVFAALFLAQGKASQIVIGIHSGAPYYDCSVAFVDSMSRLLQEHTDGRVTLIAPLLSWNKGQVFEYFTAAGLPIQETYSCEAGTSPVCGTCASCKDRRILGC
jgi:7-cyano-7-deazaguanine synthase